jgi:large subunit ribosomal protein L19
MSKPYNPQEIVESIVADQLKGKDDLPLMSPGDTIDVHYRIIEGEKERIQIFQGVLLSMNGRGINRTITVRRIVANEGVERIFPMHSPRIARIDVIRRGDARRAKLYFLRDRIGKARRLRDQRRGHKHIQAWEQAHSDRVAAAKQAAKNSSEEQDTGK